MPEEIMQAIEQYIEAHPGTQIKPGTPEGNAGECEITQGSSRKIYNESRYKWRENLYSPVLWHGRKSVCNLYL